jgi:hypothetical protein
VGAGFLTCTVRFLPVGEVGDRGVLVCTLALGFKGFGLRGACYLEIQCGRGLTARTPRFNFEGKELIYSDERYVFRAIYINHVKREIVTSCATRADGNGINSSEGSFSF